MNLNSAVELLSFVSPGQDTRDAGLAKIISEGQGPFSYDPRANVGTLLCRSKFGMEAYPDLIDELSGQFVETLFDLQADQDSKLEFRESRTMLSGFAGSKDRTRNLIIP